MHHINFLQRNHQGQIIYQNKHSMFTASEHGKKLFFPLLLVSKRYTATARQYKFRVSPYFYHVLVCMSVSQQNQIGKLLRGIHTPQYIKMSTVTYVNFSASLNFFIFCLRITLPYNGSFSSNFASFVSNPSNLDLAGGGSILST